MEFSKQIMYTVNIYQLYLSQHIKQFQIGLSDYSILLYLYGHCSPDNPVGQNEIARNLKRDKALIARAARNLVKLDYISVSDDPHNKSKKNLSLTEKGLAIVPQIKSYIAEWEEKVLSKLNLEEMVLFKDFFDRIYSSSEDLYEQIYQH